MKTNRINLIIVLLVYLFIAACDSRPKVVEGVPLDNNASANNFKSQTDLPSAIDESLAEHIVKVEEVLNTERYSYLNVTEKGEKFWIAIPKKEIEIGGTYYYKGGLLKRNFESKEYKRVFETLYLVSDVIPQSTNLSGSTLNQTFGKGENSQEVINITPAAGSIKLSELFAHPEKYKDKLTQVTGKCVKVNPMIMDRNWIHIQDGSGDGLDLTITTVETVAVGDVVSFEGVIGLNKDFGAGYRYDIIMEKAILK